MRARPLLSILTAAGLSLALGACGDDSQAPAGSNGSAASLTLPSFAPHQAGVELDTNLRTLEIGARCVGCHDDVIEAYRSSGMHDALTLPGGAGTIESTLVGTVVESLVTGMRVSFDVRDGKYVQRAAFVDPEGVERASYEATVDLIVGSGHATRTYLTVRDGRLLELPLTWYRGADRLDFSPGPGFAERLLRNGDNMCVSCHTGTVSPIRSEASVGFQGEISLGISCERCHGPSDAHVESGDLLDTVNPARLPLEQQQQLCAQCHLSAGITVTSSSRTIASYRPGEDLRAWLGVFEAEGADGGGRPDIAGHGVRLRRSRCFTATEEQGDALTCTTCHNPHLGFKDTDSAADADRGCLVCHKQDACHEDEAARGGRACASCHMASVKSADIQHTRVSDHWIRRELPEEPPAGAPMQPGEIALSGRRLIDLLDPDGTGPAAAELQARAYARGVEMARMQTSIAPERWVAWADGLTASWLASTPGAAAALRIRGQLLRHAGRLEDAYAVLEAAREAAPGLPGPAAELGYAYLDAGRVADAQEPLAAALRADPYDEDVGTAYARALYENGRPQDALDVLAKLRERIGPTITRAHMASVVAARTGHQPTILKHVYDVLIFEPKNPDVLTRAGALLIEMEEPERARSLLRSALVSDPQFMPARNLLKQIGD